MKKLETIDPKMAQDLHDRLYFTVRMNLVPKKGHDNFLKDQQARELTAELISKLDGLFVLPAMPAQRHTGEHYRLAPDHSLEARARLATAARPHQLPIMNARPATRQEPEPGSAPSSAASA